MEQSFTAASPDPVAVEDALGYIKVLGKNVEAEWAGSAVDPLDRRLDRTNGLRRNDAILRRTYLCSLTTVPNDVNEQRHLSEMRTIRTTDRAERLSRLI